MLEVLKSSPYEIPSGACLGPDEVLHALEGIDLVYRTLCGVLYNFVPTSGHPGGSISSGRIVEGLIYHTMDYDFSNPDAEEADVLIYAAGHKAMGLYAMWALRNELIRIARPELLPEVKKQLRLEDLLGFRRNPTTETPLFKKFNAKPLDGHPTPATPFVKIATGASGVGVPASFGYALGALDSYGDDPPRVHVLEGEGGMTPGRVHEALAAAAAAQLYNVILHVDWNQASIDTNRVCRDDNRPGDYVQWNPMELTYCHDWNVIFVPEGRDFRQVLAAQQLALSLQTHQPTAVIYRTVKGWKYGIEGRASHGAGHQFCSEEYYTYCAKPFEEFFGISFPRFAGEATPENIERTFFDTLMVLRAALERRRDFATFAASQIAAARERLATRHRKPRPDAPKLSVLYENHRDKDPRVFEKPWGPHEPPPELQLKPGQSVTLRAVLGDALNFLNKQTGGALLGAAADLLRSTSVNNLAKGFPEGYYNAVANPGARLVAVGGICEDAMGAFMAGLSSFGHHIGVTSSYGAFIAALEHIAARLHGIGQQARASVDGEPYRTWIMVNAHAGVKTGEDGPTHADPQALQLLQENFPKGVVITLTPWDPQEIWPLLVAGLQARPAVLAPFVTRPNETVLDRARYGLPPASAAVKGVYAMRRADPTSRPYHGTLVLQGNGVATIFVTEVMPKLDELELNLNVYYIASAELFDLLPPEEQEHIFPEAHAREAIGITDFTLPTLYRWVRSTEGIRRSLHPFRKSHYLGSGQAHKVLEEAGLHAAGQLEAILDYARAMEKRQPRLPRKEFPMMPEGFVLQCARCHTAVDPVAYFALTALPSDENCEECEYRSFENCAYCRAYWMVASGNFRFMCEACRT